MNAGKAIAYMFKEYGSKYMFGMPGGQHYPIYLGIDSYAPDIQHIHFRCEKDAAFAAMAYAMVTGKPGLCDGTVGPGAMNLVPGIAEAWAASIPVIAISGDVPTAQKGKWAAQECNMTEIMPSITKKVIRVERVDKIPESVREAYRLATTGRPGPIHLIIPADILQMDHNFRADLYVEKDCSVFPARRPGADPAEVQKAVDVILKAKKPVILAGGGVITSGASDELIELAELLCAPVATSMMGKGSINEDHPLSIGAAYAFANPKLVYGLRGHELMAETDLAIFVGTRADDQATGSWHFPKPGTPTVHIDIDPKEIGRNYLVSVGIVADAKLGLRALVDALEQQGENKAYKETGRYKQIRSVMDAWHKTVAPKINSDEIPITGHRIVKEIQNVLNEEGILVTGASFVPYYASGFYSFLKAGRSFISPRGMGSLGSGLAFTIGAKLGAPDRQVIGLGGDGDFAMAMHELETMKRANVKATFVLLNNSCLGQIVECCKPSITGQYGQVDYVKIAEAHGCLGIRVSEPDKLKDALLQAEASDLPALIEVISAVELPTTLGSAVV